MGTAVPAVPMSFGVWYILSMRNLPILLHVPKCGGTTLIMAVTGAKMPPKANDRYRHVLWNEDKTMMHSNAGDIFTADGVERYEGRQIILCVRNPLDRLESEFGFLGNREEFRELWKRQTGEDYPATMLDYVGFASASDSITKFLLGRDLYDPAPVSDAEFGFLMSRLHDEQFTFGLTHQMELTTKNIERRCGYGFNDELPRYRISLYKPERDDQWGRVEEIFTEHNAKDLELFELVSSLFAKQTEGLGDASDRSFVGDVNMSALLFTTSEERRSPFEIYANDLADPDTLYQWVEQRKPELIELNANAIRDCGRDGKRFLILWLEAAIARYLPESADPIEIDRDEPLKTVRALVRTMFG